MDPAYQGESAPQPLLTVSASFPTAIRVFIRAWFMKFITSIFFRYMVWRNPLPRSQWPTYTKKYIDRPGLISEARIFIPKSYKSGDKPLPLLIDVHGGGFMVGHPVADDRGNSQFAYEHGFLVVSIPYRLSPTYQFPTPTHDVADTIRAVLSDTSLPIDHSRVAIIGYSAGGNLALSACQVDGLHQSITAYIGMYPSTDFATDGGVKHARRVSDGKEDVVYPLAQTFYYGYVPAGVNRKDPLLSPLYADRSKLPKNMFLTGCEYDMLCWESRALAERSAEGEKAQRQEAAGGDGWVQGRVRWELVRGQPHGYDQMPEKDKAVLAKRRERATRLYADVAKWLHEEAFVLDG